MVLFQPTILEMKESTDRVLGVIGADGVVVACTDPALMGTSLENATAELDLGVTLACAQGYTLRPLRTPAARFDFAAFVEGEDEMARAICILVASGLNNAKDYYDERHDQATFIKHIMLDNVLPGDIYLRSKELNLDGERRRAVLLIRQSGEPDNAVVDILKGLFPDRQRDYIISLNEWETALIKEIDDTVPSLYDLASIIDDTIRSELMLGITIGIGAVCRHIKDIAAAYKEAQTALEVGKVFETDKTIMAYDNLGLGRLIYQLPVTMCEMFLSEVFQKSPLDMLDRETLDTVVYFFANSLNISEASRKLFIHRNTLVYRLDKIQKLTGLDLREFDHAVVFKVAMMVHKYLANRK